MRIYKKYEKAFTPVVLELESQDEVDLLYAIFNLSSIIDAVKKKFDMREFYKKLHPYKKNDHVFWSMITRSTKF